MTSENSKLKAIEPVDKLKEFTIFPKLPAEIRLHIWRESFPGPRIIELYYHYTREEDRSSRMREIARLNRPIPPALSFSPRFQKAASWPSSLGYYGYRDIREVIRTNTPSPAVLTVCRESRHEALKTYLPIAHCDLSSCYPYFDPHKDTIFISGSLRLPFEYQQVSGCKCCQRLLNTGRPIFDGIVREEEWSKIQSMILDNRMWANFCRNEMIYSLKGLKQLTIASVPWQNLSCYRKRKMERRNIYFFRPDSARHARYVEGVQDIIDVGCAEIQERHPDWVSPQLAVTAVTTREVKK